MTNHMIPVSYSLATSDQQQSATLVADQRFGHCMQLSDNQPFSIPSTANPVASFSVWLKRLTVDASISCSVSASWEIDTSGAVLLNNTMTGQVIPQGQWFHICQVINQDVVRLYINGQLVGESMASQALSPTELAYISNGQVCLAHQHVFQQVLDVSAVQTDFLGMQPTAKQAFTQAQPLAVSLVNPENGPFAGYAENKLFIVDSAGKSTIEQQLVVQNISDQTITLDATNAMMASASQHHLEIRLRNGVIAHIADQLRIEGPAGWSVSEPQQNLDDHSWSIYLLATQAKTLVSSQTIVFVLRYRTADGAGGERGTLLNVSYQQLASASGNAIRGDRNLQVDILNLSSNNAYVREMNEKITAADAKVDALEQEITGLHTDLEDAKTRASQAEAAAAQSHEEAQRLTEVAQQAEQQAVQAKQAAAQEKREAEQAKQAAETAQQQANKERAEAEAAKQAAESANAAAAREKQEAEAAKIAAQQAEANAATEHSEAQAAKAAAQQAESNAAKERAEAQAAKDAAERANQLAADAQRLADAAKEAAQSQNGQATDAKNVALQAQQKADDAKAAAELANKQAKKEHDEAVAAKDAAITAQNNAKKEFDEAVKAKDAAVIAQNNAKTEHDQAVAAKEAAITAQNNAKKELDEAVKAKDAADDARILAEKEKQQAVDAKDDAAEALRLAGVQRGKADDARKAAETAKTDAQNAKQDIIDIRDDINKKQTDMLKALDDEIDTRFDLKVKSEEGELFEPMVYATSNVNSSSALSTEGLADQVAVNQATDVLFELKNQSKKNLRFDQSNSNRGIDIYIPIGSRPWHLVSSGNNITGCFYPRVETSTFGSFTKKTSTSSYVIYRWTPPGSSNNDFSNWFYNGKTLRLTLNELIPNGQSGVVPIKLVVTGLDGYPTLEYTVNLMKVTKDLDQFVGGGNVGIGTGYSEPSDKLTVQGTVKVRDTVRAFNTYYEGSYGDLIWKSGENLQFGTVTAPVSGKVDRNDGFTERMRIASNGNVGIGTGSATPAEKLTVEGATKAHVFMGCGIVPVGTIIDWYRSSSSVPIPDGWRVANGAVMPNNNTVAPELQGKRIPNLQGRFVRGETSTSFSGYHYGGSDSHDHGDTFYTDSRGNHNHNWLWYSGKSISTYNSGGGRNWFFNWGNGHDNDGSGSYSYTWDRFHDGYTNKQGSHTHNIYGSVSSRTTLPRYVGLLKLIRVL